MDSNHRPLDPQSNALSNWAIGTKTVRVGFEPTDPGWGQLLSREPDSASLAPHLWFGEGGIRTPGPFQINGFQDRLLKPLGHLSICITISIVSKIVNELFHGFEIQLFLYCLNRLILLIKGLTCSLGFYCHHFLKDDELFSVDEGNFNPERVDFNLNLTYSTQ